MEEFDIVKVVYAMYLALQKKCRDEVGDNEINVLERKFLGMLDEKQLEVYERIQKLYAKQEEFNEKDVVRFVLNFIKNIV